MSDQAHHDDALKKLGELIRDIQFAMMTTVEPDGSLRSRPMATHQDPHRGFDGVLWFFTKADAPKVGEVRQDQHVSLTYASSEKSQYVSLSGTAGLVRDPQKARELWDPRYIAWFPQGLDDPDLALLRVAVTKAEYWDTPSSTVVHLLGMVKAMATGQAYQPGDHEKVTLGPPQA